MLPFMPTCKHSLPELYKTPDTLKLWQLVRNSSRLAAADSNLERIKICLELPSFRVRINKYVRQLQQELEECDCGSKNSEKAHHALLKYHESFLEYDYGNAFGHCCDAIRYAVINENGDTPVSEELSEAYFLRAELFWAYFKQYDHALADINDALAFGYDQFNPVSNQLELKLLKAKCLALLGRKAEANDLLDSIQQSPDIDQAELEVARKYTAQEIRPSEIQPDNNSDPTSELISKGLFTPHSRNPWLSSKVEFYYHPKKGRTMIALEKIEFGEVVAAVDQPVASVIFGKQELLHCHHCGKMVRDWKQYSTPDKYNRFIPCFKCSRVLFCSDRCRIESWDSYHHFECDKQVLPILQHLDDSMLDKGKPLGRQNRGRLHLAFRALLINQSLTELKITLANVAKQTNIPTDRENSYEQLWSLDPYFNQLNGEDQLKVIVNACLLTKLATVAGFLPQQASLEDEIRVGSILLRHLVTPAWTNQFIEKIGNQLEGNYFRSFYCVSTSTFKHSCAPNVKWLESCSSSGRQYRLVKATQTIARRSEITMNYDVPLEWPAPTRTEDLPFTCHCDRCAIETRDILPPNQYYFPFGCDHCGGLLVRDTTDTKSFHCSSCDTKFNRTQMRDKSIKLNEHLCYQRRNNRSLSFAFRKQINAVQFEKKISVDLRPILAHNASEISQFRRALAQFMVDIDVRKAFTYATDRIRDVESQIGSNESLLLLTDLHWMKQLFNNKPEVREEMEQIAQRVKLLHDKFYGGLHWSAPCITLIYL